MMAVISRAFSRPLEDCFRPSSGNMGLHLSQYISEEAQALPQLRQKYLRPAGAGVSGLAGGSGV